MGERGAVKLLAFGGTLFLGFGGLQNVASAQVPVAPGSPAGPLAASPDRSASQVPPGATAALTGDSVPAGAPAGEIVVTGSRIARRDYVASSPILTVSQATIAQTGAVTLEATLNQLPQFTPSTGPASTFPNHGGQANINLRGLGTNRALVLFDGRRVQPSNPDGTIDVNIFPTALIDNVETITGGASSTYGSDAMAGVVNFKPRHQFTGLQLDGQVGITGRGDGGSRDLSLLAGQKLADGRLHVIGYFGYSARDQILQGDRSFSRIRLLSPYVPTGAVASASNPPSQAAINMLFARYGYPSPGPITNFGVNPDGTLFKEAPTTSPVINYRGPLDALILNANNAIVENASATYSLQIPLKRYTGYGHIDYDLTNAIQLYAEALYTHYTADTTLTDTSLGATGQAITVPVTNPFIPADLRTLLASRSNPAAPFNLTYLITGAGPQLYDDSWSVYQLTGGARGRLGGGITWDIYASYGHTRNTDVRLNGASISEVEAFLNAPGGGAAASDPVHCAGGFNPFGQQISADCTAQVLRTATSTMTLQQTVVEGNLQGPVVDLPGGSLRFAAGADYRRESYGYRPDLLLQQGDLSGSQVVLPASGSYDVKEIYGELLIPLVHDLPLVRQFDVNLGYRYSGYDTVGGVSTYKANFDWSLLKMLRLRGGYSRAVRAPGLSELYAATNVISFSIGTASATTAAGDPCDVRSSFRKGGNATQVAALCAAQGVPAGTLAAFTSASPTAFGINTGNPNLEPERADTYSIGAVLRSPTRSGLFSRLQASIDYFSVDIDRAIGQLSLATSLPLCFNADGSSNPTYSPDNFYCQYIQRDVNGIVSNALVPTLNLGSYKTTGVDLQLDWAFGLGAIGLNDHMGSLTLSFVGTYTDELLIQSYAGGPKLNYAGSTSGVTGNVTPRWRTLTSVTYTLGRFGIGMRWRRLSALFDTSRVTSPSSTVAGVPAVNYFDLDARIRASARYEFRLGINNLTDKKPPQIGTSIGNSDYNSYDPLGRRFYVAVHANF